MMEYARVSVHTVEQFKAEVNAVLRLTSNLSGCEATMTELHSFLDDLVKNCGGSDVGDSHFGGRYTWGSHFDGEIV